MDEGSLFIDSDTMNEAVVKLSTILGDGFCIETFVSTFDPSYGKTDEEMKKKAKVESLYRECIRNHPDPFFLVVGYKSLQTNSKVFRSIACSLLRYELIRTQGKIWTSLAGITRAFFKSLLLFYVNDQTLDSVLSSQITSTVMELGHILLPQDSWKEFYDFVRMVRTPKVIRRVASIILWFSLVDYSILLKNLDIFHSFFERAISDAYDNDVKINCIDAYLSLLKSASIENYPQAINLIPVTVATLRNVMGSKVLPDKVAHVFDTLLSLGPVYLGIDLFNELEERNGRHLLLTARDAISKELLFSIDTSQFEELVLRLNSSEDAVRLQAQGTFDHLKENHLHGFTNRLLMVLTLSVNKVVQETIAARFPSHLDYIMPLYDDSNKCNLQTRLWLSLMFVSEIFLMKKIGYIISKMCIQFNCNLADHIKSISEALGSDSPEYLVTIFSMLSDLLESNVQLIDSDICKIFSKLHEILKSSSPVHVRVACLLTSIKGIRRFSGSVEVLNLQAIIIQNLHDGKLRIGQDSYLQKILISLNDLAVDVPQILNMKFYDLILCVLNISETDTLDENALNLALEFLITLVESGSFEKGSLEFGKRLFKVLLKKMHVMVGDNAATESSYHDNELLVNRLATSVDEEHLADLSSQPLHDYVSSSDWTKRYAAINCVVQLADGYSLDNMGELVALLLHSYHDEQPKVQLAATCATERLLSTFKGKFKFLYGQEILLALELAMAHFKTSQSKDLARDILLNLKRSSLAFKDVRK